MSVSRCRLRPLTFLPASKPRGPPASGHDALAVDDPRCWRRLAANLLPSRHEQGGLDRRPDAVLPEAAEIAVHRAPRRELTRQHAPWAAGAEQIQQRVQHLAQQGRPPPPAALGRRQQGLDQREFRVGDVVA